MSSGGGMVAVSYQLFGAAAEHAAAHSGVFVPVSNAYELVDLAARVPIVGVVQRSELRLGASLLAGLPALRFVVRAGSGLDNIDTAELARRNVTLWHNRDEAAESVAELAWLGLTALARKLPMATVMLRNGKYDKSRVVGEAVGDLVTAVWGAGRIGRAVLLTAQRHCASAVPVDLGRQLPAGTTATSPSTAIRTADAHILCLPLNPGTRGRFDKSFLDSVADQRPYLCNIARYELLDMSAAVAALRAGTLRGLFVDPLDREHLDTALANDWLADDQNLLLTMHQGAQRADVRRRLDEWAIATALRQVDGTSDEESHGSPHTTTR